MREFFLIKYTINISKIIYTFSTTKDKKEEIESELKIDTIYIPF